MQGDLKTGAREPEPPPGESEAVSTAGEVWAQDWGAAGKGPRSHVQRLRKQGERAKSWGQLRDHRCERASCSLALAVLRSTWACPGGHERVQPLLLFHLRNSALAWLQVPTDFRGREEGETGRTSTTHLSEAAPYRMGWREEER